MEFLSADIFNWLAFPLFSGTFFFKINIEKTNFLTEWSIMWMLIFHMQGVLSAVKIRINRGNGQRKIMKKCQPKKKEWYSNQINGK